MPSEEVVALRQRPIGNIALEVLLALGENKIGIAENQNEFVFSNKLFVFKPQAFTVSSRVLSNSANMRLGSIIDALVRREYIVAQPILDYKEKSQKSGAWKGLNKFSKESFGKLAAKKTHIYTVTEAGKKALQDAPSRVRKFKRELEEPDRYVITAKIVEGKRVPGVGGIYRIDRISPSKIFISSEPIPHCVKFDRDDSVVTHRPYGGFVVKYVVPKNVLMIDAKPEHFNHLMMLTQEGERNAKQARKQLQENIRAIHNRSESIITQINQITENKIKEQTNLDRARLDVISNQLNNSILDFIDKNKTIFEDKSEDDESVLKMDQEELSIFRR